MTYEESDTEYEVDQCENGSTGDTTENCLRQPARESNIRIDTE